MKQLKKTIKHATTKIHPKMCLYILPKRLHPMPLTLPAQGFLHSIMSIPYALTYAAHYHNRSSMMPGPVSKWA